MGRAIGALFPFLIGALSKQYAGTSIGIFAVAAYGVVIVAALTLPETRGRELDAAAGSPPFVSSLDRPRAATRGGAHPSIPRRIDPTS